MSRGRVLVDTDVLSAILRRDPIASARFAEHVSLYGRLTWSVFTSYEILRGLRWKHATGQERIFRQFREQHEVLPLTQGIADLAANMHAETKARGVTFSDADMFIAATAMSGKLGVATGNEKHFGRIPQLHIENWLVH